PVAGVLGAAPWVEGQGMLTQSGAAKPLLYYGIDPSLERTVSILPDHMTQGSLSALKPGDFGIVLGAIMARQMGVTLGDAVTLLIPEASLTIAGVRPRLKRLTVVGVFEVGAELDANLAYLHWQDAAILKRQKNKVDGVRVRFDNLFNAPVQLQALARDTDTRPRDWTRTHGNLFEAIALEKTLIGLLLAMIVAVAAFNIVATLVMTVNAKRADIAVLRVMGMGPSEVLLTFIVQGVLIGLIGIVSGALLGLLVAFNVPVILEFIESTFGFTLFRADAYFISYLPSDPQWSDITTIVVGSFLLCLVSTLYPAWRASRTEPAEVIAGGH
ncbi:MAG: FtsX-like permease family protein, partial [Litorivicinus sp.]